MLPHMVQKIVIPAVANYNLFISNQMFDGSQFKHIQSLTLIRGIFMFLNIFLLP